MSRRARLLPWIVAAVGALAWPVFFPRLIGVQTFFLAVLFCLVRFAPGDSIRLPRRVSNGIALAGVLLVQTAALIVGTTSPVIVFATIAMTAILLFACDVRRVSPWWIVPAVWGRWTAHGWVGIAAGGVLGIASLWIAARHARAELSCRN